MKIFTEQDYIGHWHCYDETYDGSPDAGQQTVGYGITKQEAIEDYNVNKEV